MPVAFELTDESLTGPVVFPGFPGVWTAGQPVSADELVAAGVFGSVDEARELIADLGLPFRERRVKKGAAPVPTVPNHVPLPDPAADAAPDEDADDETDETDETDEADAADPGVDDPEPEGAAE